MYGLERCDDVSYDGFDITRDEYDGLFNSLVFYIKYKSKNESINENWCDDKLAELQEKGKNNWNQDDWETYAYCKNANAERDWYDSQDEPSWAYQEEDIFDDYEIKKEPANEYKLMGRKTVYDSDGFTTDYSWYKDDNGHHVFVFGDSDLYRPEDGVYDWEEEDEGKAKEWFDNYKGFEEEEESSEEYWS